MYKKKKKKKKIMRYRNQCEYLTMKRFGFKTY